MTQEQFDRAVALTETLKNADSQKDFFRQRFKDLITMATEKFPSASIHFKDLSELFNQKLDDIKSEAQLEFDNL